MRKSITGFICGLIGSLFSLFWGFVCGITGSAFDFAAAAVVIQVLGWVAFLGSILGIVGAALCFKKARKGAICLSIATLLCGVLQIYIFVNAVTTSFVMSSIIVFLLPTILLIVSAVFAWIAKEVAPARVQMQQPQQPQMPQQENYIPPIKEEPTLEKELNNLKNMLDKKLITEEEFAEAKRNILNKYTK